MSEKKTVLITGATSGIGLETAKGLAESGFHVIGTYRNEEKKDKAISYLGDSADFLYADMSSQKSIKELAENVKAICKDKGLDVLINNAGSFYSYYSQSDEGVEKQFAVNAAAPLLLTLLLYKELKRAGGRVINVSSSSHYNTRVRWNDIQLSRRYSQLKAYKQSKLISVMVSKRFNELSGDVKIFMADPGLVNTEMGFKNTNGIARLVWKIRKNKGRLASEGAKTSLYLATENNLTGFYYKDLKAKAPDNAAMNEDYINKAWSYMKKVIALDAEEVIKDYGNR